MRWLVVLAILSLALPARADRLQAETQNEQGKKRFAARDYEGAARRFRRAYELSPDARYAFNLCVALDEAGEADDATAACNVVLHDPSADAVLRGKAQERLGRMQRRSALSARLKKDDYRFAVGLGVGTGFYASGFVADSGFRFEGRLDWAPAPGPWMLRAHFSHTTAATDGEGSDDLTMTALGPGVVLRAPLGGAFTLRGAAGLEIVLLDAGPFAAEKSVNIPISGGVAWALGPHVALAFDLALDMIIPVTDDNVTFGNNGMVGSAMLSLEYRFGEPASSAPANLQ